MKSYEKDQLLENVDYTSLHVSKVNDLVAHYHRIHNVPFNTLSAIVATVVILLLLWASGVMNVVHVVMQSLGSSIISIEYVPPVVEEPLTTSPNDELEAEEEPLIDFSFITSFFTADPKFSASAVFKYAMFVALFDTLLLVGVSIGLTYGGFYSYQYFKVKKNRDKLNKIVEEINVELAALEQSVIPEEYWHVPYLQRMKRYIEQNRADNLREVLDLVDLDIRHKQIIDAITNDEGIDTKALSESVLHPKSKVLKNSRYNDDSIPTNLVN